MRTCTVVIAAALVPAAMFVLAGGLGVLAGCENRSAQQAATPARGADKVYTSRGKVESLPDPKRVTAEFVVHHEAINDFVNPNGSKGMNSMSMPLTPDASVDLSALAVGDIIEFDLSVWYKPEFKAIESYRVTRVKKLPPDTELHFGTAVPTL